jgi:hypothetical protein
MKQSKISGGAYKYIKEFYGEEDMYFPGGMPGPGKLSEAQSEELDSNKDGELTGSDFKSLGSSKLGEPDPKDDVKAYIGETDSGKSDYQKRFDKENPGTRDSDRISRYRIEQEYDPSGVYYTGDSDMYSKDKTKVPGIRNPNYNPGSNATAEFNKLYPHIKNIAAKSDMINKAALRTFGGNTSNHNKGFMQNKGNYGVGQVNDFGGVNNTGNKESFIKNLKYAHHAATTGLNVKPAEPTFGKLSTPSNQEFNSLTRKVINNPNPNKKSNRRKSKR